MNLAAKAKFMEAWKADPHIEISPAEFPPKFLRFLEGARKEAEASQPPPRPSSAPSAPATSGPGPTPSRKGGSKALPIVLGAAAAAGIGVAVATGGSSSESPRIVEPTPCPPATASVTLLSATPPSGSTISVGSCANAQSCPAAPRLRLSVNFDETLGADGLFVLLFDPVDCFSRPYPIRFVCGGQTIEAPDLRRFCTEPRFSTRQAVVRLNRGTTTLSLHFFNLTYEFVP